MKSLSNQLLALLSAAALIIAVGACKQPSHDTNTPGATPESQPGAAPENTPPAQPGAQPADEAGGGPAGDENQPATPPANEPGANPAEEPAGGGPDMNQPSDNPSTEPTEPTGGGPETNPGTEQNPAAGSSEKSIDERLQQSRDKINEGLDDMRNIAAEQAASGEVNAKRAAEDLQSRATEAQKSIESGIEKLKQESKPNSNP